MMVDDSMQPLSVGLDKVVRSLRGAGAQATHALFGRWEAVVGEAIAAHARPAKLDGGRLVVEVDEPGWATQLRYLEGDVLARLQAAGVEVTGIDVRVRPLSVTSWRFPGPADHPGAQPSRYSVTPRW